MPDIAGAMQAIEDRFTAAWVETPTARENDDFRVTFDTNGFPLPFLRIMVEVEDGETNSVGRRGDRINTDSGTISIMSSVGAESGPDIARQNAALAGEIFRDAQFYDDTPGFCVRTWKPTLGRAFRANSENPEGLWFVVTVTIPFEFISIA